MKKSILKGILSGVVSTVLLSSCLGDTDNFTQLGSDFVYVDSQNGQYYAASSIGYISFDGIGGADFQAGECYDIGFKATAYNNPGDITKVTEVVRHGKISQAALEKTNDPETFNRINFASLSVNKFSPISYYGDRWLFHYTPSLVELVDGDDVDMKFYYNPLGQHDKDGLITEKNRVVIDVHLSKKTVGGELEKGTRRGVGNLSDMRYGSSYFANFEYKDGKALVYIKFRYTQYNTTTKLPEEVYIGSWLETGNPVFQMYFEQ